MTNKNIIDSLSKLRGKKPRDVRLGHGSFITMEFGESQTKPASRFVHGEWHLALRMCAWRIETRDAVLAASEDQRETIQAFLESTVLGSVESIEVSNPSLDISIQFSSGFRILTFSYSTNNDEQWLLFTPGDRVLTVYGRGRSHEGRSDEPRYEPE
ncbi:MAG: hypothetical protein ABSG16_25075 [Candidatus Acidiferrum sp.]|jgi:hypothetical protein